MARPFAAALLAAVFVIPAATAHSTRWWWSSDHAEAHLFLRSSTSGQDPRDTACAGTGPRIARNAEIVGPGFVGGGKPGGTPNTLYKHFVCVVVPTNGLPFGLMLHVIDRTHFTVSKTQIAS